MRLGYQSVDTEAILTPFRERNSSSPVVASQSFSGERLKQDPYSLPSCQLIGKAYRSLPCSLIALGIGSKRVAQSHRPRIAAAAMVLFWATQGFNFAMNVVLASSRASSPSRN